MKVNTAQLPGPGHSNDRVFITPTAAIVLDGASAFNPVTLDASTYTDALGHHIATQLHADPHAPLLDVVSAAITAIARRFDLRPGHSPSSTITILRIRDHHADLYLLGDSPLYYGTGHQATALVDTRLTDLELPETQQYHHRLRAGSGYDSEHHTLLRKLQERQRARRNTEHGYWIAETDPAAAHHAITTTLSPDDLSWAVLATDGLTGPLTHLGRIDWATIVSESSSQLTQLLTATHHWEHHDDPHGKKFPRAKRHDDKTIAVIPAVWS